MRSIRVRKFRICLLLIAVVLLVLYTLPLLYVTLLHGDVGKFVGQRWSPFAVRDAATRADLSLKREEYTLESTASTSTLTSTSENVSFTSDMRYHGHDLLKDVPFTFDKRFKNPCWYDGLKLKCLPYFFVIGVKKGGTSELFGKIMKHPEVISPGFKEAQFFARGRFEQGRDDINMYVDQFTSAAHRIQSESVKYFSVNTTNPFITGEGSPSNLHLNSHWMSLPGNEHLSEPRVVILDYIRHFVPNAKLIITFRDPIERLYSDFYHEYSILRRHANTQQFHQIVARAIDMYTECFDSRTVRSCVYDPEIYTETKIQVQLGIYHIFWEELVRVFPREQILVVQNKNISTIETYRRLYSFLNIAQLSDIRIHGFINLNPHANERSASYKRQGPMFNFCQHCECLPVQTYTRSSTL